MQQESVDQNYLASSKVGTPDPRQVNPPIGTNLIIAWDLPKSLFMEGLSLQATVRLWDNTQTVTNIALNRKRDTIALFYSQKDQGKSKSILTYKVEILNGAGEVIEFWQHPLWTDLIVFDL